MTDSPSLPWALDPEVASILEYLPEGDLSDVHAARAQMDGLIAQFAAGAADTSALVVVDHVAPGSGDQPDVPVRVYTPLGDGPEGGHAALCYLHGGGFVMGSIETEHLSAAQVATELGVVVVSVEYRLAPEHPFPAPRTATTRCAGCTRRPTHSASTAPGSRSWARRPAAASRPRWR